MRQSSVSGDGRAVSRARVGGDLRWGMSWRGDVEARTRAVQEQSVMRNPRLRLRAVIRMCG
jgi:hypothetical protein